MKEIKDFIKAVENEEFVFGHEVLEDRWREYKTIDKNESYILKGLINGSTSLALYKMGRIEGSHRVWDTFLKYKPLIETSQSKHVLLYIQARDLLEKKRDELLAL